MKLIVLAVGFTGGGWAFARLEVVLEEVRTGVKRLKTEDDFMDLHLRDLCYLIRLNDFSTLSFFSFEKHDQSVPDPKLWLFLDFFVKGGSLEFYIYKSW